MEYDNIDYLVALPSCQKLRHTDEGIERGTATPYVGLWVVHGKDSCPMTYLALPLTNLQLCRMCTCIYMYVYVRVHCLGNGVV